MYYLSVLKTINFIYSLIYLCIKYLFGFFYFKCKHRSTDLLFSQGFLVGYLVYLCLFSTTDLRDRLRLKFGRLFVKDRSFSLFELKPDTKKHTCFYLSEKPMCLYLLGGMIRIPFNISPNLRLQNLIFGSSRETLYLRKTKPV